MRIVGMFLFLQLLSSFAADPFNNLSSRFSGTPSSLRSAAFGAGAYIAVGDRGTILRSTDTITWVPMLSGTTNDL